VNVRRHEAVAAALLLSTCGVSVRGNPVDRHRCTAENPVTHWTAIAATIFPGQPGPILDGRAMAILHASIHDAVNGVERRYQPYTADLASPTASVDAAVATAAHDVLLALAPDHRDRVESEYAAALATVPDGSAEDEGVALGRQCASANLDRRAGDGVPVAPFPPQTGPITEPVYVPNGTPGDYDFTPPFDRPPLGPIALFPGWGRVATFAADARTIDFDGPDPLPGRRYARDFNYLKAIGSLRSTTRTAEQTQIARFWFEPLDAWYRIAATVLRDEDVDTWRSARVLALMSFAVADADILVFEAKYRFRSWRPYTAIRRAGEDGNDATEPDENWLPLLWTEPEVVPPHLFIPPIPEYPSSAAAVSAAAAEVLRRHLGDRHSFEATSTTLPGVTRVFGSFSAAARETRLSRVYGGIHFLRAIQDGRKGGARLGAAVSRMLPPVHR
jgi:membrane-associated phospholipid phosphatase